MVLKSEPMDYEVALSFASEDRAYVEMVARFLKAHGVRFFYDAYESVGLWGKDLYGHLVNVYSRTEKFVVMFISHHYAEKIWTNHERRAAQSRALQERGEYILPVRFDDTEIEGLLHTVACLDARRLSPEVLATMILEKLGRPVILSKANAVPPPHNAALKGVARFDYSAHDARFEIGTGDLLFETRWGSAGPESVYCYNDAPSVRGVAVAPVGAAASALADVSTFDFTSRHRCPSVGQFVILENTKGFFAVLRIDSISGAPGGVSRELCFTYWIRADAGKDFSREVA